MPTSCDHEVVVKSQYVDDVAELLVSWDGAAEAPGARCCCETLGSPGAAASETPVG
jgi:hypothetical protein